MLDDIQLIPMFSRLIHHICYDWSMFTFYQVSHPLSMAPKRFALQYFTSKNERKIIVLVMCRVLRKTLKTQLSIFDQVLSMLKELKRWKAVWKSILSLKFKSFFLHTQTSTTYHYYIHPRGTKFNSNLFHNSYLTTRNWVEMHLKSTAPPPLLLSFCHSIQNMAFKP